MGLKPLAIVAGVACLSIAGCTTADRSAHDQARTVFQVLREHEHAYQAALEAEQTAIAHTRAWVGSASAAESERGRAQASGELGAAMTKVTHLRQVLSGLEVQGQVRSELLDPIVDQLRRQEQDLRELQNVLEGVESDSAAAAHALLERHGPTANLFTPALRKLREVYGVARQRTWRGHPLTA